jgi:hypothetical protein
MASAQAGSFGHPISMIRSILLFASITATGHALVAADFAGPNQFICGTTAVLGADQLGTGESGFWQVVSGTADFMLSTSPTTLATNLSFGENVLRWTVITSGGPASDLVSIFCYDNAMPEANAGPDQDVPPWPGTAQMNASQPTAPAVCFWTVVSGTCFIANTTDPLTLVSGVTGPTVLQWTCDNGPCGITADDVFLNAVVGIGESVAHSNVPHYDPAHHRLVFSAPGPSIAITLFDQQGRLVEQMATPPGAGVWDLTAVPSGIYVVQVRMREGYATHRFVVNH